MTLGKLDQLVRLNIGVVPIEVSFPDWACVSGDVLYKLLYANGDCRYVRVPLDDALIASIHARGPKGEFSLYRDADGRITPVARFVGLFCLERDVPIGAISRQLGVSEGVIRSWRREHRKAASIHRDVEALELLRMLAFRAAEEG